MTDTPTVRIGIELIPDLHAGIAAMADGIDTCRGAIGSALLDLTGRLGVPISPDVRLRSGAPLGGRPLSVTVGERLCPLPRRLLTDTARFRGTLGLAWYHPTEELATLLAHRAARGDTAGVSALLAAVVADAVRRTASALLTPAALRQWALRAGLDVDAALAEALDLALRLGLSIDDHEKVRGAVEEMTDRSLLEVSEELVARLAPAGWQIAVHPRYLDELFGSINVAEPGSFPTARETLFTELGIRLPGLTLSEDSGLPALGFGFVIGRIRTPPFIGLPPDALLAVAEPGRPAGAVDPVSGAPAAVVPADALPDRTTGHLISPLGLVADALRSVARDHAATTVTAISTVDELGVLLAVTPTLAAAGWEHRYALTRLRRSLLDEGISIRDLRSIVQAVLDEKVRAGVLPEEAGLLRGVRLALRSMVTAAAASGTSVLKVRRLPPDLEAALRGDGAGERGVTTFVARAVDENGPEVTIVTSAQARSAARSVVAAEFPEVHVVADNELAPDAVIAWSPAGQ